MVGTGLVEWWWTGSRAQPRSKAERASMGQGRHGSWPRGSPASLCLPALRTHWRRTCRPCPRRDRYAPAPFFHNCPHLPLPAAVLRCHHHHRPPARSFSIKRSARAEQISRLSRSVTEKRSEKGGQASHGYQGRLLPRARPPAPRRRLPCGKLTSHCFWASSLSHFPCIAFCLCVRVLEVQARGLTS